MRSATDGIDYTSRDYEGFRQAMIAELATKLPEYTDRSSTDAGIVIIELLAKGLDVLSYYLDAIANETLLPTIRRRDSAETWCKILCYTPRKATAAKAMQVFVLTAVRSTDYTIPMGTKVKVPQGNDNDEIIFETTSDLVIPAGMLGNETDNSGNYLYSVEVEQGVSVFSEPVGSSTGVANQEFDLHYSPVVLNEVEVWVNEGDGWVEWQQVDTFTESSLLDKHYMMRDNNDGTASIIFGDGVYGKIPEVYDCGIRANYRVGGGEVGNVAANTINVMETNLAEIDYTFNPAEVFERGYERESIEEIKVNAPAYSMNKWGALTLDDFSDVVKLNFPSVIFASSYRDNEMGGTDTDDIHIFILTDKMDSTSTDIDSDLREKLEEFFDENRGGRKIVGADDIYFHAPTFVSINLKATLRVHDRYSRSKIVAQITDVIENGFAVGNYNFEQELSLPEVSADITNSGIEGIRSFYLEAGSGTSYTDTNGRIIKPNKGVIFTLGTLTFDASGGVA